MFRNRVDALEHLVAHLLVLEFVDVEIDLRRRRRRGRGGDRRARRGAARRAGSARRRCSRAAAPGGGGRLDRLFGRRRLAGNEAAQFRHEEIEPGADGREHDQDDEDFAHAAARALDDVDGLATLGADERRVLRRAR